MNRTSPQSNLVALKRVVDKIHSLPTLPEVMTRLLALVSNPHTSSTDVEEALRHDPSLSLKILRVANSAFYGCCDVRTLHQAILLLGFPTIRSIVLAASVFETFPGEGRPGFNRSDFWEHSLAVAVAAKQLAAGVGEGETEEAFMAGLIHDIGKVIFDEYASDLWQPALNQARQKKILLFQSEYQLLGLSHAQLGHWLASKWKLPDSLANAIFHHHHPSSAIPEEVLPSIIHIADILARQAALGSGGDSQVPPLDPEALKRCSLDEAALAAITEALPEAFEKARASFPLPKPR